VTHNDLLFNLYRLESDALLAADIRDTARTAGNILRRQSGAVAVQNLLDAYTVLLLRPDYIADEFGKDTYLTVVTTPLGAEHAVALARAEVAKIDQTNLDCLLDYAVLAVFAGAHDDLNTENACYVTGYLVAANEAGALLAEHRTELIQWIANTERAAKQPEITEGERSLYRWRHLGAGGFERRFWEAVMAADSTNLEALAKGFPTHVTAYQRYAHESGYWPDLQARIEGKQV
jgi:hypothetical protein